MMLKILFPLIFIFYACAPLRPLGPVFEEKAEEKIEKKTEEKAEEKVEKVEKPDRHIINVGIGFEKSNPKAECEKNCSYSGKTYRGKISVLSTDSGYAVINTLPIEEYLKGVVPHEIGALKQDAFEALKAQAVAARTYAYSHLGSRKSQGFDVFADTRDQVYNGSKEEDELVNKAIEATSGVVIKYNGNLIEAYYHSTCGGRTESTEVWGQASKPYLVSVSDSIDGRAFCELSKYSNWSETFTKKELNAEKIFIIEKFPSNRVKKLVVFTAKDSSYEILGDKVRWFFTKNGKILPSALFTIKDNGDSFTLEGSGFGHGVGMCQVGAIARARAGQKFDEILKAYYTGVSVEEY